MIIDGFSSTSQMVFLSRSWNYKCIFSVFWDFLVTDRLMNFFENTIITLNSVCLYCFVPIVQLCKWQLVLMCVMWSYHTHYNICHWPSWHSLHCHTLSGQRQILMFFSVVDERRFVSLVSSRFFGWKILIWF